MSTDQVEGRRNRVGAEAVKSDDFHMRIDPKLKERGEKAAAADGRSLSSLLQKLLMDYLAGQKAKG